MLGLLFRAAGRLDLRESQSGIENKKEDSCLQVQRLRTAACISNMDLTTHKPGRAIKITPQCTL